MSQQRPQAVKTDQRWIPWFLAVIGVLVMGGMVDSIRRDWQEERRADQQQGLQPSTFLKDVTTESGDGSFGQEALRQARAPKGTPEDEPERKRSRFLETLDGK